MAQPTTTDVHVNVPLTNMSVAYIQDQKAFRAAEIFPLIPVQKMSDKYFYYTKDYWFTNEAKVRGEGAETEGTGYGIDSSNSYGCQVYGLHKDIGDQTMANADVPLNMQRDAALFLTQKLLLAREKVFVDNCFTPDKSPTTWATEYEGYAHGASQLDFVQWDDTTYGTPIQDIRKYRLAMAAATGFTPNTLVLGPHVFEALIQHPDVLERIKYGGTPGSPAVVSEQALAQVFDIDRVVVPMAVMNSAAEGATASIDFMYGRHALLCYSNPAPSLLTPSAGYTFAWTGYLSNAGPYDNAGGPGWFSVRNFRMEWRRALRVEAEMAMDMKVVASDLGVMLEDAVSSSI